MLIDLDTIEISSEYESPIRPTAIKEDIMRITVGSSSIPKRKWKVQRPSPMPSQKRQTSASTRVQGEGIAQTRPSRLGGVESVAPQGVSVHEILGYVTPTCPRAKLRYLPRNQKYPPKFPPLPEGMKCSVDIIPALIMLKFYNHDLLLLRDVRDDPYESVPTGPGAPIRWIP